MNNTESAIVTGLNKVSELAKIQDWKGETLWTSAVKQSLVDVGREFGWLIAANKCDSDEGKEWLYDE